MIWLIKLKCLHIFCITKHTHFSYDKWILAVAKAPQTNKKKTTNLFSGIQSLMSVTCLSQVVFLKHPGDFKCLLFECYPFNKWPMITAWGDEKLGAGSILGLKSLSQKWDASVWLTFHWLELVTCPCITAKGSGRQSIFMFSGRKE